MYFLFSFLSYILSCILHMLIQFPWGRWIKWSLTWPRWCILAPCSPQTCICGQIVALRAGTALEGKFTSLSDGFRNQGRWIPSGALFHDNVPAEVCQVCAHLPVSLVCYLYSPLFFPEAVILSFLYIFKSYTHTHTHTQENKNLSYTHAQINRFLRKQRNQATVFTISLQKQQKTWNA